MWRWGITMIALAVLSVGARAADDVVWEGERLDVPSQGISMEGPAGWVRLLESIPSQLLRFSRQGAEEWEAHITLEVQPKSNRSLRTVAGLLRDVYGGTLYNSRIKLSDEETVVIVMNHNPEGEMHPRRLLITEHDDRFYSLLLASKGERADRAAFDTSAESLRLTRARPPIETLEEDSRRVAFFANPQLRLTLPESYRMSSIDQVRRVATFKVTNVVSSRVEATLRVERTRGQERFDIERVLGGVAQTVVLAYGLEETPRFEKMPGRIKAFVTEPYTVLTNTGEVRGFTAVTDFIGPDYITLRVLLDTTDEKAMEVHEKRMREVIQSVRYVVSRPTRTLQPETPGSEEERRDNGNSASGADADTPDESRELNQ